MRHVHLQILVITHTHTNLPTNKSSPTTAVSFSVPAYKMIPCPPGVYNCNVAPSLRCTGSNDIFPRSCHRLPGFGASLLKNNGKCCAVKGGLCLPPQTSSTDKILNSRRCYSGSRKKLTPLWSALFLTGDGSALLRHHIATTERKLTRKEIRIIYMWTGF